MFDVSDIFARSRSNGFLIYNNNASKNILFIGACRSGGLAFYFNNLEYAHLKRNIYYIYVVDWMDRYDALSKSHIQNILANTDMIVCENVKQFGILNTNETSEISFFKEFSVSPDISIYRLPNLDFHYPTHSLINIFGIQFETDKLLAHYNTSKERLFRSLHKYNTPELSTFIDSYFRKYRLFYTFNHPSELLLLFLFKNLMKRINITLDVSFLERMIEIPILYGNNTPIYETDIVLYQFMYQQKIENERLYDKEFYTNYPFVPQVITDELRTEWLK